MSQLSFVTTLPANGSTADGDDLASLLNEIKDYLNNANLEAAELSDDSGYHTLTVPIRLVSSAGSEVYRWRVPAGLNSFEVIEMQYAFESASAGTPELQVGITAGGDNVFSATQSTTSTATLQIVPAATFTGAGGAVWAAGEEIVITLTEGGGGGDCQDVSVTIVFKSELDS